MSRFHSHDTALDWHAMARLWRPVGALVAVVLIAGGCTSAGASHDGTSLRVSGRIEGNETHIGVLMPARVQAVNVQEGDSVKKGEVLVQLDDGQISDGLADANAVLSAAEDEQKLAKKIAPAGGMEGQVRLAALKTAVAKAKAKRDDLQHKKDDAKITSPVDGVCSADNVHAAEVVMPGQSLLNIVDLNSVYVRAFVPESNIGAIKIGQSAKVYLDSQPDKPLTAKVVEIDPQASFTPENVYFHDDRVKQVFGVKIKIDNASGNAKPGMPADAEISLVGDSH